MSPKAEEKWKWNRNSLLHRSRLRIEPSNVRPNLVGYKELGHPGGPGEPIGAVKGGDIGESILGRHSDRG